MKEEKNTLFTATTFFITSTVLLETTSSTFLKIRELLYLVKLQPLDGYKYCYSINNSTYTTDTLSMQFV